MYPKQSYSWTICSNTVFYKKIDKSVMLNKGSGIPMEIKHYWDADKLEYNDVKHLKVIHDGVLYKMKITLDKINRTRLFWYSDFDKLLSQRFYELKMKYKHDDEIDVFPELRFEKIDTNKYLVEFVEEFDDSMMYNDYEDLGGRVEGKKVVYYSETYERSKKNRDETIKIHGLKCKVCGFKFEDKYGYLGKGFIEVHHKKPLYINGEELLVNPKTDLVPVCSNCHRMIHRKRNNVLSIDRLKEIIEEYKLR